MKDYLWVIEENTMGRGWLVWDTRPTRARARRCQFFLKQDDADFKGHTRVVKYIRDDASMRHPCDCPDCAKLPVVPPPGI